MRDHCDKSPFRIQLFYLNREELKHGRRRLTSKNRTTRRGFWNERTISTMKTRKTAQINEENERTSIEDTTTQSPERSKREGAMHGKYPCRDLRKRNIGE